MGALMTELWGPKAREGGARRVKRGSYRSKQAGERRDHVTPDETADEHRNRGN